MSAYPDRAMIEQAIAWHIRLRDAHEDVWGEFAEWLNADPAHNSIYEAVADSDTRLLPILEKATFPPINGKERTQEFSNDDDDLTCGDGIDVVRPSFWRRGAIAASLALVGLFAVQMLSNRDGSYSIETVAGETRTISLADGSEVQLNGSTIISLDKNDARLVEITRGEARFVVEHDESDPFTVIAGKQRLVDIGTVFNVVRTDQQLRVGVAEGAVRYEGMAQTVELRAGDSLVVNNSGAIKLSQYPPTSIGSWADGVLVYHQAPLQQVADDLSRSIGVSFALPQGMLSNRFSGVIQTDGTKDAVRARLEELLGEKIVVDGTRWSVQAR